MAVSLSWVGKKGMCRWVDESVKMQWMEFLVGRTKFQLNK